MSDFKDYKTIEEFNLGCEITSSQYSLKNKPLDSKLTPVATYPDLGTIPYSYRYNGMTVVVLSDENSGGKMAEYWLNGGKTNKYWCKKTSDSKIDFEYEDDEES